MKNIYLFLLCILSSVLFCSDPNNDDHKKFLSIIMSPVSSDEDIDFVKKYLTNNKQFINAKHQGYTPLELFAMWHKHDLFNLLINDFIHDLSEYNKKELFFRSVRSLNSYVANHHLLNETVVEVCSPQDGSTNESDELISFLNTPPDDLLVEALSNVSTYVGSIDNSVHAQTNDSKTEEILSSKKSELEKNRLQILYYLCEKQGSFLGSLF